MGTIPYTRQSFQEFQQEVGQKPLAVLHFNSSQDGIVEKLDTPQIFHHEGIEQPEWFGMWNDIPFLICRMSYKPDDQMFCANQWVLTGPDEQLKNLCKDLSE